MCTEQGNKRTILNFSHWMSKELWFVCLEPSQIALSSFEESFLSVLKSYSLIFDVSFPSIPLVMGLGDKPDGKRFQSGRPFGRVLFLSR